MTAAKPESDKQKQKEMSARLAGLATGAHVSAMVSLGVRLGLYRALDGAGPLSSETLAERTKLHERWLREWLYGQASAEIIEYRGDDRFELSPEAAALLAEEDSVRWLGALFESLPQRMGLVGRLEDSFRTGLGLSWDDRGPDAASATDRMLGNWHRQVLVPVALPMLDGVVEKLRTGATAADVGCGSGIAVIEMAKAFPRSSIHGYDNSANMLALAESKRSAAGLDNVRFHHVEDEPLPDDASLDLILTIDCLHDMAHPERTTAAVRAAIAPDGVWFIADADGGASFEENLRENAQAAGWYAISVLSCMSSSMSEPGATGYGTLGLPEPKMRELVRSAGFTRFRRVELSHPFNAYYEARP